MWKFLCCCFTNAQQPASRHQQVQPSQVKRLVPEPQSKGLETILEDSSFSKAAARQDSSIKLSHSPVQHTIPLEGKLKHQMQPSKAAGTTTRQRDDARLAKVEAMLEDWEISHELFLSEKAALLQSRAYMDALKATRASIRAKKICTKSLAFCRSACFKPKRHTAHSVQPDGEEAPRTDRYGRIIHSCS